MTKIAKYVWVNSNAKSSSIHYQKSKMSWKLDIATKFTVRQSELQNIIDSNTEFFKMIYEQNQVVIFLKYCSHRSRDTLKLKQSWDFELSDVWRDNHSAKLISRRCSSFWIYDTLTWKSNILKLLRITWNFRKIAFFSEKTLSKSV